MTRNGQVLISEGGSGQSRAALAAVRALRAAGYETTVTMSGPLSLAGVSRDCSRRVRVPRADLDPAGYAAAMRAERSRRDYVAVLPASDAAMLAMELPVDRFLNKVACADGARRVGLEVPPTQVFASRAELLESAAHLPYPVVVKPAIKYFAAQRVDGPDELRRLPEAAAQLLVQPFLGDRLHGLLGVMWQGSLVAAVHLRYLRIWPLPCGTVAAAETIAPDPDLEDRIEALASGYDGLIHADMAGPYLLDLNPRVHASLPVAVASGTNLVALYCDLLRGQSVARRRGRSGFFFRHAEADIRSVIHQVRRRTMTLGEAVRALRPRRGAVHSVLSLRDPLPVIARFGFLLQRVLGGGRGHGRRVVFDR